MFCQINKCLNRVITKLQWSPSVTEDGSSHICTLSPLIDISSAGRQQLLGLIHIVQHLLELGRLQRGEPCTAAQHSHGSSIIMYLHVEYHDSVRNGLDHVQSMRRSMTHRLQQSAWQHTPQNESQCIVIDNAMQSVECAICFMASRLNRAPLPRAELQSDTDKASFVLTLAVRPPARQRELTFSEIQYVLLQDSIWRVVTLPLGVDDILACLPCLSTRLTTMYIFRAACLRAEPPRAYLLTQAEPSFLISAITYRVRI